MNFRQLFENQASMTDYDIWRDKVSTAGGEIHPQRDRVHLVAQSWDGDVIGEFNLKTNQGWFGTQGVTENTTPNDEKVIELFAQIVADDTGYSVKKVNYEIYDEGLRTPSGIPVYFYSFDGDVRYIGALPGGKPTAIVNQDGEVGGRGSYLELSIGGKVQYVIKGNTLFSAADQQKIANAKPGDDEYSLVLIALDLMWGRMQHKFMEQGVAEGLPPMGFVRSPQRRDPLKNPTRTYIEISKMLGIASRQLQGLVRSFPGFPAPIKEIG